MRITFEKVRFKIYRITRLWILQTKFDDLDEPVFKIFFTCLNISLPKLSFPPTKISREDYREIYGRSKTSNRKN